MPVFDHIEQGDPRLRVEGLQTEVVEDQYVHPFDAFEIAQYRPFGLGQLKLAHQLGRIDVRYPITIRQA